MIFLNIALFTIFNILFIYISIFFYIKEKKNSTYLYKYHEDIRVLKISKIIFLLGLYFLIISISRPVIEKGETSVEVKGLEVLIALDFSASMRSRDIFPNRLEFAKKKMINYINLSDSNEISIAGFSNSSFLIAPLSSDKNILIKIVQKLNTDSVEMRESNFLSLAKLSKRILKNKKQKILIIFSDGGENRDLIKFSKILKKNNIYLYVVLIGTEKGAPILNSSGKTVIQNSKIQISKINLLLGEISIKNSGFFIIGKSGDEDMKKLMTIIQNNHKDFLKKEITIKNRIELFYYPLLLGLLLIFLSIYLTIKRKNV